MLASLVGYLGDFDKAEDAVQEAFAIAAVRWPKKGEGEAGRMPANPGAWLVTTARSMFRAYAELVESLKQWYAEPPAVEYMTVIGSYRLF